MEAILIKILYVEYGWTVQAISAQTGYPKTYIEQVIEEEGLVQPINDLPALPNGQSDPPDIIDQIKTQETHKQATLAPLYTIAEVTLLEKTLATIQNTDPSLSNAHEILKSLSGTLQSLKTNAIINTVKDTGAENNAVSFNVINVIQ